MRFLAKITIPTEKGDAAFKSGALPRTMRSAMDRLKPEAAYFFEEDGKRECLFVFNLDVPALLKPLFPELDVSLHVTPVMNAAEFEQGLGEAMGKQPLVEESEFLADINPVAPDRGTPVAQPGVQHRDLLSVERLPPIPADEPANKR